MTQAQSGAQTPLDDPVPLNEVQRALVVKLRHYGDVLLTSPVFTVLKQHSPHVELDALVYDDTAEMLSLHPALSEIHCIKRDGKVAGRLARLRAELQLWQTLRQRRYDLLVLLDDRWRGLWLARTLRTRWQVAPEMTQRGKRWHRAFTHLYPHPKNAGRSVPEFNLDALRRIGIHPSPKDKKLTLVPGDSAQRAVEEHLTRLNLRPGSFIHIHPASRWRFKCWSTTSMVTLIRSLQNEGWPILLTGAPGDSEAAFIADINIQLSEPVPALCGRLTLKQLAALTAQARLFIGVDSAPMHMAAAMQTPVVVLFGPSGEKQWGPWGVPHRVVASSLHPCRPCGIDGCGGGKLSDCLLSIQPLQVLDAVHQLLADTEHGRRTWMTAP